MSQLDARAVLPGALTPFSARQYEQFRDPNPPFHIARQAVEPHDPDTPLYWTLGHSLTQDEPVYVPLTYCYDNTPFEDERYMRWNSNGCAAGNTLAEAVLQGFLELVERDAVAMWWYNKISRPEVALQSLSAVSIEPLQQSLDPSWYYWVLDLTHDFNIPVMAAIGQHRETPSYRMGFGSHLDPEVACFRALTELCQLIAIEDRGTGAFDFARIRRNPIYNRPCVCRQPIYPALPSSITRISAMMSASAPRKRHAWAWNSSWSITRARICPFIRRKSSCPAFVICGPNSVPNASMTFPWLWDGVPRVCKKTNSMPSLSLCEPLPNESREMLGACHQRQSDALINDISIAYILIERKPTSDRCERLMTATNEEHLFRRTGG